MRGLPLAPVCLGTLLACVGIVLALLGWPVAWAVGLALAALASAGATVWLDRTE
jgi:hypothetical protein